MPAPTHNRNRLTHGCRTLVHGRLPAGGTYIARIVRKLAVQIEAEVMRARGEINVTDAASINTAIRWERHALLCQRWLRIGEGLTPSDQARFSREICTASERRDAAIRALGIGRGIADANRWDTPAAPPPLESPPDAAGRESVWDVILPPPCPADGQGEASSERGSEA